MAAERRSTAAAAAAVIVLDSSDDDGDNDNDNTRKKSSGAAKTTRETTAAATTTFTHTKLSPPTTTTNNNRINRGTKSVRILSTSPATTAAVSPTTASSATRRIKPTLLSTTVSSKRPRLHGADSDDDDVLFTFGSPSPPKKPCPPSSVQTPPSPAASRSKRTAAATTTTTTPKTPISAAFGALLAACRAADPSDDMEQLITRKLTRYYHTVHPDYVGSKSFRKEALRVAAAIRAQPSHVYLKLAGILEELNIRRKSGAVAVAAAAAAAATDDANAAAAELDVKPSAAVKKAIIAKTEPDTAETTAATDDAADQSPTAGGSTAAAASSSSSASPTAGGVAESPSTGNAKKDQQIKRLNHALYVLKKRIASLDEAEVDLNDEENSTFLLVERYKKRACEIYEKICDITGESKNACRSLRKPIVFQGTAYPLFNRTIQSFVNRTKTFPDLFDVRRCLDHCNQQYEFDLSKEEVLRVAQDAFVKIGKLLQRRRKLDLYETVAYFTTIGDGSGGTTTTAEGADAGGATGVAAMATMVDPATNDVQLQRKLAENDAAYTRRINAIIDKYADIQDRPESAKSMPVKSESTATTDKAENAEATSADDKSANKNPTTTTTEAGEEAPSTISDRSGDKVVEENTPAETVDDANSSCIILDDD